MEQVAPLASASLRPALQPTTPPDGAAHGCAGVVGFAGSRLQRRWDAAAPAHPCARGTCTSLCCGRSCASGNCSCVALPPASMPSPCDVHGRTSGAGGTTPWMEEVSRVWNKRLRTPEAAARGTCTSVCGGRSCASLRSRHLHIRVRRPLLRILALAALAHPCAAQPGLGEAVIRGRGTCPTRRTGLAAASPLRPSRCAVRRAPRRDESSNAANRARAEPTRA